MANPPDLVTAAAKATDPDRYVTALYAPAERRAALMALYAFDGEIAGIRGRIREALPGEIRLQWWRDTLDAGRSGAVTGHPVADGLNAAIGAYGLPVAALQNYLDARIFDLYDDPMPSRTDLEGYCGETQGAILQLAALVLDAGSAPRFADLAGRAACAQGIAGMLRALPLQRARGQCFVPRDILAAAGTSPEAFLEGDGGQGALRAVEAMTALARDHLSAFETGAADLPPSLRPVFLPLALTRLLLDRMTKPADILGGGRDPAPWRRQWTLFRHASKGWGASGRKAP